MNRLVMDASFCGAWVLEDESSDEADHLLAQAEAGVVGLLVPALWKYEMLNLLRSACRRGRLEEAEAGNAAKVLSQVPLDLVDVPDATAQARIFELARAYDLSAYDATYLELALRFKLPLRTSDRVLKKAALQCGVGSLE
jgi:predicted nucleic acid-binding protein